jgi:phosphohistidine phosphatase SixA
MGYTALAGLAMVLAAFGAAAQPSQVIIVRHAERAADPSGDPSLSPDGVARAALLAQTLGASNVRTIITTHFKRTQETAAPLAQQQGITPAVIPIRRGELAAHISEVVQAARQAAGVVLVVGHSDTVPGIVAGLSKSQPMKLCETSFSNIFIATLGLAALQLKYGKPDVAPGPGCQ